MRFGRAAERRNRMGRLIFVSGGAGSGKSAFGEAVLTSLGEEKRYYIATMRTGDDPENRKRAEKHRRKREGKGFITLEYETIPEDASFRPEDWVLLEDLSNLVSHVLFDDPDRVSGILNGNVDETGFVREVTAQLSRIEKQAGGLVIVGNDVFSDAMHYDAGTGCFLRVLCMLHRQIAEAADTVVQVIAGIPVYRKGDRLCLKD